MDAEKLKKRVVDAYHLGRFAGWEGNKNLAVYRWFPYKEAFSKQLMDEILSAHSTKNVERVLDPFCGTGTTILACLERGISAVGVEASRMMVAVAKTKTTRYNAFELRNKLALLVKEAKKMDVDEEEVREALNNPLLARAFSPRKMKELLALKKAINNVCEDGNEARFFRLALATAAYEASALLRDGAVFKQRKRVKPALLEEFERQASRMIQDVASFWQKHAKTHAETGVVHGDARNLPFHNESFDLLITSPPYLKKEEYVKVYGIERFCMLNETMENASRFLGTSYRKGGKEGDESVEEMVESYFNDLGKFLVEAFRCLRGGGSAYIIIGDACIDGKAYDCCFRTAEIASKTGFEVKRIYMLNERWCVRQRVFKTSKVYEAAVWIRKP